MAFKSGSERTSVNKIIQDACKKRGWDTLRLENNPTSGVPDLNLHVPGSGDVWVESKFIRIPPKTSTSSIKIGLRRQQCVWLTKAKKAGRIVFVVAKIGETFYAWDGSFDLLRDGGAWWLLREKRCMVEENIEDLLDNFQQ